MARRQGGTLSGFTPLSTPSAPTIDSVTTGIGSASVAFTAPTDVGDAAVSSYVVTAVDESSGASTGATGSASPITVSPPAGGTFKIRMQALNAYGPGRLTEYDTGHAIYGGAELYAWGWGNDGRLGDNTVVSKSSPVQIGALTSWSKISASITNHAASIKTDNTLWTWGANQFGQLGDNTVVSKSSPVQIGALTNWSQVSAGGLFTAAVKTDNTLWTWGTNIFGKLGNNTQGYVYKSSPSQVGALTNWAQLHAGSLHTAAVKTDGTLWAWGRDPVGFGTIGDNTVVSKSSPVQIGSLTNWSKVSTGGGHTAAIKTDGTLWTWGYNSHGQLGDGTRISKSSPVQVGALTNWSNASCGYYFSASVRLDGTLWSWGRNNNGQLGFATAAAARSSPVQIGALTDWSQVSCGDDHCASTKTDGTLWSWGQNSSGELGVGTVIKASSPVQVGVSTNWFQVDAGAGFTLALYGVV